jgi:hypothetical protein
MAERTQSRLRALLNKIGTYEVDGEVVGLMGICPCSVAHHQVPSATSCAIIAIQFVGPQRDIGK